MQLMYDRMKPRSAGSEAHGPSRERCYVPHVVLQELHLPKALRLVYHNDKWSWKTRMMINLWQVDQADPANHPHNTAFQRLAQFMEMKFDADSNCVMNLTDLPEV